MTGFAERYRATEVAMQAYVAGLPLWVNVWRGWMFLVFGLAVVFLFRKREARWLALTMVVSLFAYNVVAIYSGVGRFPSIAFVALWAPLAVFLARRRGAIVPATRFDRAYAGWLTACLVTLCVSLTFDVYNVAYSIVRGLP
jgi:hypothetical protein